MDVDLLNLPEYVDLPPNEMKNWTYNPKNMVGPVNASTELRMTCATPA
jgi:hypothetical protein